MCFEGLLVSKKADAQRGIRKILESRQAQEVCFVVKKPVFPVADDDLVHLPIAWNIPTLASIVQRMI